MPSSRDKPGPRARIARVLEAVRRRVPPGLRSVVGVLCIAGGLVGFLPIVGFWMLPLGVALIWLDLRGLLRRFRREDNGNGSDR
ncbi:hypothetical protein SAMN05444722_0622 [Rhodovulum sp. ES.010]|uniref:hypothetical protein n=1 Tax=Rhodovulum sp. ES.010 TaxID=1882821 RepID=UPI000927DACD|nr:hypothetical protein [Rhodovulum sp. ES.010]SIO15166.1 hypothetical protein SAMN05444722_0622 [Rhodovulum sp. ES.010]